MRWSQICCTIIWAAHRFGITYTKPVSCSNDCATIESYTILILESSSGWTGLSSVLRPRQHSIGYMGDGFCGQVELEGDIHQKVKPMERRLQHTCARNIWRLSTVRRSITRSANTAAHDALFISTKTPLWIQLHVRFKHRSFLHEAKPSIYHFRC